MTKFVAKIVAWINAGYPDGVPGPDRVPLLALLRRRLTDDEVKAVAAALVDNAASEGLANEIDLVDIGVLITQITNELPSPDDVERVRERLAAKGWPLDDPRDAEEARIATLRPVGIRSGAAALAALTVVDDVLHGRASVLPVPTDDARQTALLTTALRAGEEIDDAVAVVLSTSGTTGPPKGALLTATALVASAEATHLRLGGPGRWLLALPAYHVAGFQVLVRSVVAGTDPVAVPAAFGDRDLVAAIAALGPGRRYASLVAAQLDGALRDPQATRALAELDAVLIGGGPMPAGVAERASAAGVPVVRTYGMSETAGGCVYDGVPLDGVGVKVDAGGRISLGGPTVASGYRNPVVPDPFAESRLVPHR